MSVCFESPCIETYASLPDDIVHANVPMIYANDYDGTLGKTGHLPQDGELREGSMGLLLEMASLEQFDINPKLIIKAWKSTERDSGSFNAIEVVQQQLAPDVFDSFCTQYEANKQQIKLLYEDAQPYLGMLRTSPPIPDFTLTYGNPRWQKPKTSAANIGGHVEITNQRHKGPVMEAMTGPTGSFDFVATNELNQPLVVLHATAMTLVDDKPASFDGLSGNCYGIHVDRLDEPKKRSQHGKVDPAKVRTVHSLLEIERTTEMTPEYDDHTAELMLSVVKFIPVAAYARINRVA